MKIFWILMLVSSMSRAQEPKLNMEDVKANFQPLPKSLIDTRKYRDLIELGKDLYFEKRLSINDKISCNSCHQIDKFGVDNEATSPGHDGKRGERNSPTTFNAGLHFAQFWDGRAKNLEEQALGPILNPIEMGMPDEQAVMDKLSKIPQYVTSFQKAFPFEKNPMKYKNVGIAIGAFEKTLLTESPFDDFLRGKQNALSPQAKRGLQKFIDNGCVACHNGVGIGGNSYQKLGLVHEYKTEDLGRYNVTKNEDDKKVFKVPTLRNVVKTGPYFHDGSVKTLDEAIRLMAYHQLGLENLSKEFVEDIKAFLESLTAKKQPKVL